MRLIVLTVFAACAAAPALAASMELVSGGRASNGSMVSITCKTCPPPAAPPQEAAPDTAGLNGAVQKEEIREVHGERMIMRTERWMGGSPSVFYQKLTPAREAAITGAAASGSEAAPAAAGATAPDGIDAQATTAAVSGTATQAEVDFSAYQLRFN